jgi:RHS repeat-associated protein
MLQRFQQALRSSIRQLAPSAGLPSSYNRAGRSKRLRSVESLEPRRVLALPAPPAELVDVSDQPVVLAGGHFTPGSTADLVSIATDGSIDLLSSENNQWISRTSSQPVAGPILGGLARLINNDSYDDLLLLSATELHVLTSDGAGGWQSGQSVPYTPVADPANYPRIQPAIGFADDNVQLDFVVPLPQSDQIAVFAGIAAGEFASPIYFSSPAAEPVAVGIANLLGTPHADLVVGHRDGTLSFFEGDGSGHFELQASATVTASVGQLTALAVHDFDSNGKGEVLITGSTGAQLVRPVADPQPTSPLSNGQFAAGLSGWNSDAQGHRAGDRPGSVRADSGLAELISNQSFLTSLSQTIVLPDNPQSIQFDLLALGLAPVSDGFLPHAFEVSLLDGNQASLVPTHRIESSAFANFVSGEEASIAAGVTLDSTLIRLDISALEPGTQATVVFDLITPSAEQVSSVAIDNVDISPARVYSSSFTLEDLPGPFSSPFDVAAGDIDGDGRADIVISDRGGGSLIVLHVDAEGNFQRDTHLLDGDHSPTLLALAPYTDGDTAWDIAVALAGTEQLLTPLVAAHEQPPTESKSGDTRFFVVDMADKASYRYSESGESLGEFSIASSGSPRGAATTATGNPLWVVTTNKQVHVFDTATGSQIGSWRLGDAASPEGIATDGQDIWVVDKAKKRVYRYAGAADRRSGLQRPTSSFPLAHGNRHPAGLTTDGQLLWVVDAKTRKVFVYDLDGQWVNWWNLDADNADPSGLTIRPGHEGLWVVDIRDRRVYAYPQRQLDHQGSQNAVGSFALAPENKHPQGIADPVADISIGDTVSESLAAGDSFEWTFVGQAGQDIYVNFQSLSGTSTFSYPTTSLHSPSGAVLYTKSGRQAFQHNSGVQTLSETGVYTLKMTTPVDVAFQFTLYEVPPPDVQPIEFDQVYSGAIETPGAEDHWTFTATAGASVNLDVQSLSTVIGGDLQAAILAPDGSLLSTRTSVLANSLDQQVQIPLDGTYTIVFKAAFGGAHLPSYSFLVSQIPPDDIVSIGYREIAEGAIEVAGARDQWIFHGTAGDNVFIDFLEVTGGDLQATLTSPSGQLIYSVSFSHEYGFDRELVLAETGSYTLSVQAAFGASSLHSYRFQLWDIPPQQPQPTVLNAPLSGQLVPGETQLYFFDAAANTELLLDALETQGQSLSLQLYAPDGAAMTGRLTNDQLLWLDEAGTYTVAIQRASDSVTDLDAQGAFSFRLQDVTGRSRGQVDSLGTRFYLAFPRNLREFLGSDVPIFSIAVTAPTDTSGAVMIPGLNWFMTFDVAAGQSETILLPPQVELFGNDEITDRGIIVASVDEVAVYGLNQMPRSTDGYTALPLDALGQEHLVLGYGNTVRLIAEGGSHLAIVAAEDDTEVTITPAADAGGRTAGIPFTISLDRAQTYLLYASAAAAANALDLTGTRISSTAPVAVFGGNTAAYVPVGFGAADHLIEQIPATATWGVNFLTAPLAARTGGDTLRILAAENGTEVTMDQQQVALLDAGEVYETLLGAAAWITTSAPALVAQYANGSTFDGATGDPFMMLVPPREQYQQSYTLSTPQAGIDANFANLIVPAGSIADAELDGVAIGAEHFSAIGTTGYHAARLPIGVGSHHFAAPEPFGVSIYGFGEFESYGYFGGMSLAPVATVDSLSLEPAQVEVALGTLHTVTAVVEDAQGQPLEGVRVDFTITGANSASYFALSDASGRASIQYTSLAAGTDHITATAGALSAQGSVLWLASPPELVVLGPGDGAELLPGRHLLSAVATATVPGTAIVHATVGGQMGSQSVDALDASGRFFAAIDVLTGSQTLIVSATDSLGQVTEQTLSLIGVAVNDAPASVAQSGRDITASVQWNYRGTTYDRQTNRLSVDLHLSSSSQLPLDPSLIAVLETTNSATARLFGPEQVSITGQPLVVFDTELPASGLEPGADSESVQLVFHNPQQDRFRPEFTLRAAAGSPPRIISVPAVQAVVGNEYRYLVQAIDPDQNVLRFELTRGPDAMLIDPESGILRWTPTAADAGVHDVVIAVTDGRAGEAEQTFSLTVANQPANHPPVFISVPVVSAEPGSSYLYTAVALDRDFDLLTFGLILGSADLNIDSATGQLTWPSAVAGDYPVTIQVSDDRGGTAEQSFLLHVGDGLGTAAPVITSTPVVTAFADSLYVYSVAATDPAGVPLSFALLSGPVGMQIDAVSGRISWQPGSADLGLHPVVLQVTSTSGATAAQSYSLHTLSARPNAAPVFTSSPNAVATVGELYSYAASASDSDSPELSYALLVGPPGMDIDSSSGALQWQPAAADLGSHRILLAASDDDGATAYQQFYLSVRDVNLPPEFTSTPPTSIQAGDVFRYNATALDAEDAVRYSLVASPAGSGLAAMQIDPRSGAITWLTGLADIGQHQVVVRAQDERGLDSEQQFVLTVTADVEPPRVAILLQNDAVEVGESVTISVQASDNVQVTDLQLFAGGVPVPLVDGQAEFSSSISGFVFLSARAGDASGNTATDYAVLKVGEVPDDTPPAVIIHSPAPSQTVTYLTDVVATVSDEYLASYRLELSRLGDDTWQVLSEVRNTDGLPIDVTNQSIAVFDPTLLANDEYQLRLVAEDFGGNQSSTTVTVALDGRAKIGNYRMELVDVSIPLAGIPIEIRRVYDTLQADESMDFGFGWQLDVASPRIRESAPVTQAEAAGAGMFAARPFRMGSRVYLSGPDGRRLGFTFDPTPQPGLLGTIWYPRFIPDPGVYEQLQVSATPLSQAADGSFGTYLSGLPYNPDRYTLITTEQRRYSYNQFPQDGGPQLTSITDRNGVQLVVDQLGIHSSLGPSIYWSRDAAGRITSITDPAGGQLHYEYSTQGNLIRLTDQTGNVTAMDYLSEPAHYLKTVTDPRGNEILQLQYDAAGRLIATGDALGNSAQQHYDLANNRETVADRLGNETTLVFDDRGNIVESISPEGYSTKFAYDADDNQIAVTNARGLTTHMEFDDRGNLLSVRNALGDEGRTAFNSFNDPISSTDQLGRTSMASYDALGNLVLFTDASGNQQQLQYDAQGRVTSITDFSGATSSVEYGPIEHGQVHLQQIVDPMGGVQSLQHGPLGLPVLLVDQNGHATELEYDLAGRLVKLIDPSGGQTTFQYEGNLRSSITDSLGRTTRFLYDAAERLTNIVLADGSQLQWLYDANGDLIEAIDELGRSTHYSYDTDRRLRTVTDPVGAVTQLEYDAVGNLVQLTEPGGNATHFSYDALDRLIEVSDSIGVMSSLGYDAVGNLLSLTDGLGRTQTFAYDSLDRVIRIVDARGAETSASYDSVGNLLSLTDPLGNVTQYEYDRNQQLIEEVDPLGRLTRYDYDAAGNLVELTDRAGRVLQFQYDELHRLVQEQWLDAGQLQRLFEYNYDAVGNLLSSVEYLDPLTSGESIGHSFTYDARDRVLSEVIASTSAIRPSASLVYTYDLAGNVTAVEDALGVRVESVYDPRNALLQRNIGGGDLAPARVDFEYDLDGNQISTRRYTDLAATQLVGRSQFAFDARSRPTTALHHGVLDAVLADYSYEYDWADQLISQNYNGQSSAYAYDAAGQLISAIHSHQTDESYAYDAGGNRSESGQVIGGNNQLLADSRYDYQYDLEGNLARRTLRATGERTEYSYDHRNRLVRLEQLDALDNVLSWADYIYDVWGRRTAKQVDADAAGPALPDATTTLYDGLHAWADFDSGGDRAAQYLHGDRLDEILARQVAAAGSGGAGGADWYLADRQGTVRDVVDAEGAIVNRLTYGSFGEVLSETHPADGDRFRYTGREYDAESGLYFYRARYYDPQSGRFVGPDPIGFASGDTNLYRYVGNSPTNFVDPLGLTAVGERGAIQTKESREAPAKVYLACMSSTFGFSTVAFAAAGLPPGLFDITLSALQCAVAPAGATLQKTGLVARVHAKMDLYPKVIDFRTGRNIPFPTGVGKRIDKNVRVAWDSKTDRAAFISEWHRRGYAKPQGGWDRYDIHHIQPREFGGNNDFWNLVPVERGTHQSLFNTFWRQFMEL